MLKGLLVNKFRNKYCNPKRPNLMLYIDNEVSKFLSSDRLTEDNLKKLDGKILREAQTRDKMDYILDDRRSHAGEMVKSARHQFNANNGDTMSQTLVQMPSIKRSQAGDLTERGSVVASQVLGTPQPVPSRRAISISSQSARQETLSHIGKSGKPKDDEWNAIVKFNTLIHYEEQKRAEQRDLERKKFIKLELDRQIADRQIIKQRQVEESEVYFKQ